jgi:hypothetical protein
MAENRMPKGKPKSAMMPQNPANSSVEKAWRGRLRGFLAGVPGHGWHTAMNEAGYMTTNQICPVLPAGAAGGVQSHLAGSPHPISSLNHVESSIAKGCKWLKSRQHPEGYWVAELEADTTLESYFILFRSFFGKRDDPRIQKYAKVIR